MKKLDFALRVRKFLLDSVDGLVGLVFTSSSYVDGCIVSVEDFDELGATSFARVNNPASRTERVESITCVATSNKMHLAYDGDESQ